MLLGIYLVLVPNLEPDPHVSTNNSRSFVTAAMESQLKM